MRIKAKKRRAITAQQPENQPPPASERKIAGRPKGRLPQTARRRNTAPGAEPTRRDGPASLPAGRFGAPAHPVPIPSFRRKPESDHPYTAIPSPPTVIPAQAGI